MPNILNKIAIIGAGAIGSKTLYAILRAFPPMKKLEIIFYNRGLKRAVGASEDVAGAALDTAYLEGRYRKYSQLNNISIRPTSDEKDISQSNLVIVTAGISAALSGSKTRLAALPVARKITEHFGAVIAEYAPESTVLMVTNPVDIVTKLMADKTGFAAGRVIGSGTELDARRFRRFFRYELEKQGFNNIKNILAEVVGGHSGNNMIIVRDSIRIVDRVSERRISDFIKEQDQKKIQAAYDIAESRMRTAGFDIIELSNQGASFEPAIQLALMARSFMIAGKNPIRITGSIPLSQTSKYYGLQDSVLSVPLKITKGLITIDPERFKLSDEEIVRLKNISQKHSKLIEDIKSLPPDFANKAEFAFKERADIIEESKITGRNPSARKTTPESTVKNASHENLKPVQGLANAA
jgi:malate dehydrogenase